MRTRASLRTLASRKGRRNRPFQSGREEKKLGGVATKCLDLVVGENARVLNLSLGFGMNAVLFAMNTEQ